MDPPTPHPHPPKKKKKKKKKKKPSGYSPSQLLIVTQVGIIMAVCSSFSFRLSSSGSLWLRTSSFQPECSMFSESLRIGKGKTISTE